MASFKHCYYDYFNFSIESALLNGTGRRVVVRGTLHAFALTVFGEYLYWSDWTKMAIIRANKYNGGNPITLVKNLRTKPMDLHVIAEERQNCELKE